MPPPPPGAGGGQQDNSLGPLWVTIAVFVAVFCLWYFFHTQIVSFLFGMKFLEAKLISLFTNAADPIVAWMHTLHPEDVVYTDLAKVMNSIGAYFVIPVGIILVGLGFIIYFSHPTSFYRHTHNMQSLLEAEKDNWPQLAPIKNLDLVNVDIDTGPWAMAVPPLKFAEKNNLLKVKRYEEFRADEPHVAGLRRGEAKKIFALQLGSYWENPESLKPYTKALFATFAARANHDTSGAVKLVEHILASIEKGTLNFDGTEALLKKHFNTKPVQYVVSKHAYVLTMMASMLTLARQDGVYATADFLWLKAVDRRLWYMLNNVGRQTAFPEVAGPFAHWLSELEVGTKLYVPMLDKAVDGLENALADIIYEPEKEGLPEISALN